MPSIPLYHRTLSWPSSLHHLHEHLTSVFTADKADKQTSPTSKKPHKVLEPLPDIDEDPFAHFISPVVEEDDPISLLSFSAGILPAHDDEPAQHKTKTFRNVLVSKWAKYVARHQASHYRETHGAAEEDREPARRENEYRQEHRSERVSKHGHEHLEHLEHDHNDNGDDRPASPPPLQPDTPSPPSSPPPSPPPSPPRSTTDLSTPTPLTNDDNHRQNPTTTTTAPATPPDLTPSAATELALLRLGMQRSKPAKQAKQADHSRRRRRSGQSGRAGGHARRRSWREPGEEIWTVLEEEGEEGEEGLVGG